MNKWEQLEANKAQGQAQPQTQAAAGAGQVTGGNQPAQSAALTTAPTTPTPQVMSSSEPAAKLSILEKIKQALEKGEVEAEAEISKLFKEI